MTRIAKKIKTRFQTMPISIWVVKPQNITLTFARTRTQKHSQQNRCLRNAWRVGWVRVVRWIVRHFLVRWECDWPVLSDDVANIPAADSWRHSWISTAAIVPHVRRSSTTLGYHRSQLAQRALRATVDRSWVSDDPLAGKIPDLTPCDYWLWGYKKSIVYRTQLSNLERRIY